MAKKHKKYGRRHAHMAQGGAMQYGNPQYGGWGADAGAGMYGGEPGMGWGAQGPGAAGGYGAANGYGAAGLGGGPGLQAGLQAGLNAMGLDAGMLQGMPAFLRSRNIEQFVLGAVIGAAAAWVLSDEEVRGKLVKSAMKLYSGVAGGFEEMKEQMSDIRAEVEAERHGDA